MSRTVHLSVVVRRAILWPSEHLRVMFKDDKGDFLDADAAREALLDQLEAGHRHIPVGPACDGFSYLTGCPGHDVP